MWKNGDKSILLGIRNHLNVCNSVFTAALKTSLG